VNDAAGKRSLGRRPSLASIRKRIYALMARNTRVGYEYLGVPSHRLLEVGTQVEL